MRGDDMAAMLAYCSTNGLSWRIEFTEGSGEYEVEIWGQANGERGYVKKSGSLEQGIQACIEHLDEYYAQLAAKTGRGNGGGA